MKKKSGVFWFFAGVGASLFVLAAVFLIGNREAVFSGRMVPTQIGAAAKIRSIYNLIRRDYLDDIDDEKLTDQMSAGLVAGLGDKYSQYYTADQYKALMESIEGHYTGLGIVITKKDDGSIAVDQVMADTPAARAGVKAGDVFAEVDGRDAAGMSADDVVAIIKGKKKGDTIELAFLRDGTRIEVTATLAEVESVSVTGRMQEGGVGYIAIAEFTSVTPDQFKRAYQSLQDQKMSSLVIDLRGNPGGLVTSVCDTLRQILPKGLIVYTKDKDGNREEQRCDGKSPIDIPLSVLVNGNSASAAEIFAGAVKDYGIGTLVGTKTFGKGIVQDTYELSDGSALKLTVAQYFTPKGYNIHKKGIEPDVTIEADEDGRKDAQLDKAVSVLKDE